MSAREDGRSPFGYVDVVVRVAVPIDYTTETTVHALQGIIVDEARAIARRLLPAPHRILSTCPKVEIELWPERDEKGKKEETE